MELMKTVKSLCGGIVKYIEQNKSDILYKFGVVSGGAAIILTAVETPKAIEVYKESEKEAAKVYLTETDDKKAIRKSVEEKGKGIVKAAGAYAPALTFYITSRMCYKAAHDILKADNAELIGLVVAGSQAYNALEKKFEEKLGAEKANDIQFGIQKEKIEVVEEQEDGSEKKTKKTSGVIPEDFSFTSSNELEPYKRWFTPETSSKYVETSKFGLRNMNIDIIESAAKIGTIRLQTSRDKTLSMDYLLRDELGFYETTKLDYINGWSYDEDNPRGDNCIMIKFTEYYQARRYFDDIEQQMMTRYIPIYLLEFNCDGNILEKMNRKEK